MLKRATAQPLFGFVRIGILNPPTIVDLSTEEAGALIEEITLAMLAISKEQPFQYRGIPEVKLAIIASSIPQGGIGGSGGSGSTNVFLERDKDGSWRTVKRARWP